MAGRINSFQSMGAVDGPGIRFVVFMQGCPLRCVYCHNPDTWNLEGQVYDVDEVRQKIVRNKPYFGECGGVTVSGGEPLLQWEFVSELFMRLKEEGIHTALDTSGAGDIQGAEDVLKYTDLVLCDLKFSTNEDYRQYCNGSLDQTLAFLKLVEQKHVPLWIRHVVVPGLTDNNENLTRISRLAKRYTNLEKLELLPFRKLCLAKYEAMGIPFLLTDHEDCSDYVIKKIIEQFT